MSVGAGARPSWRPLGRLVGVLLVCVIVLAGCAGLMGDSIETLMKQGLGQNPDPDAHAQLVRALFDGGSQALAAGNSTAAIDFLREYVGHDSANVSAYLELGRAYWSSGQVSSAFGAFQRVLQLSPNNAEALQFLRGTK